MINSGSLYLLACFITTLTMAFRVMQIIMIIFNIYNNNANVGGGISIEND